MANKPRINKTRYWWAVLWTENLPSNWEDTIDDTVQLPFAYCKHFKDLDTKKESRKDHVHVLIAFPNPTTYTHALNVFKMIGGVNGDKAVNTCQAVLNIRHCYDYLIHDTEKCKKDGKHLYESFERVCGNNFDIGIYEQVSQHDKDIKLREIIKFIRVNNMLNMADFWDKFDEVYEDDDVAFEVVKGYNSMIDRTIKGNYQRYKLQQEQKFAQAELDALERQRQANKCSGDFEDDLNEDLDSRGDENVYFGLHTTQNIRDEGRGTTAGQSVAKNFQSAENRSHDNGNQQPMTTEDFENATTKNEQDFERFFCPECGSISVVKNGKSNAGSQIWKCKDCKKRFVAGEKPPTGRATKQAIEQAQAETRDKKEQQTKNLECTENELNKENQPAGGLPVEPVGSFECRRE